MVTPEETSQASGLHQGPAVNGVMTPKHQWRGLLPSMASTPDNRGTCQIHPVNTSRAVNERCNQTNIFFIFYYKTCFVANITLLKQM